MDFIYTGVFNVLQLPATQVPMGLDRDGLPTGLQVVAGPAEDHVTIAVAMELERAFGGWVSPLAV
jgi:fatty acid amide hydrolase 2